MKLSKERAQEKKARDLIIKALNEYNGTNPSALPFSEGRITSDKMHDKLTRSGLDAGVCAIFLLNNLSGGSVGDVDLYRLLDRYLLNLDDRKEINAIINKL